MHSASPAAGPANRTRAEFRALGTTASIDVTDPERLGPGQDMLTKELDEIDRACSRFRGDSELSRLNATPGRPVTVSELLIQAIETALWAAEITEGDVDPTCGQALIDLGYDRDFTEIVQHGTRIRIVPRPVPGWQRVVIDRAARTVCVPAGVVVDLGATAKALAADRAASRIAKALCCGVLVNLGGDIAIAGEPPESGWWVEVSDVADIVRLLRPAAEQHDRAMERVQLPLTLF